MTFSYVFYNIIHLFYLFEQYEQFIIYQLIAKLLFEGNICKLQFIIINSVKIFNN